MTTPTAPPAEPKTTLYALVSSAMSIMSELVANGGEVTQEIEQSLVVNEHELAIKADGYGEVMARMECEAREWELRSRQCSDMANRISNLREKLRERIHGAMRALGKTEIIGERTKYRIQKTQSSIIVKNEHEVPQLFVTEVVTRKVDKLAIKEAIRGGAKVPGVEVQENEILVIKRIG